MGIENETIQLVTTFPVDKKLVYVTNEGGSEFLSMSNCMAGDLARIISMIVAKLIEEGDGEQAQVAEFAVCLMAEIFERKRDFKIPHGMIAEGASIVTACRRRDSQKGELPLDEQGLIAARLVNILYSKDLDAAADYFGELVDFESSDKKAEDGKE